MEIIRIAKDKIKIMMTEADRTEYFGGSEIDYENETTRCALKNLLKTAGESENFDTPAGRTLIQIYESTDGGCEMFLTRLERTENKYSVGTEGENNACTPLQVFSFENIGGMLQFCRKYTSTGHCAENVSLLNLNGRWYAGITGEAPGWVADYCDKLADDAVCYLHEYGTPAEISVNDLASLASECPVR